jgi:hypothetical protein
MCMNSNEPIRQALNHESLKTLLQNDELQAPSIDQGRGLSRPDSGCASPRPDRTQPCSPRGSQSNHVCIVESVSSVSDLPDFLYVCLHLRSNPTLCHRSTSGIAQQQQESATTEHNAESWVSNDAIYTQTECGQDENDRPKRKRKTPDYLRS